MSTATRTGTVSAGRTALVIAAILSLLLSLVAIVQPAIAFHEGEGNAGPEVTPTEVDFIPGNPSVNCPTGTTGIRFGNSVNDDGPLEDGGTASVTLPGETDPTTVTISTDGESLTFVIDNGLAAYVLMKGGTTQNKYDYTGASPGFAGPGIAHDDGLVAPTPDISHVDFCLIPTPKGDIELVKDLQPADDSGLFNLFIKTDGAATIVDSAPNVGDEGTTGVNTVDVGTYEVSETAGLATTLGDYTTSVSCVDRGTTNVVASGTGPGPVDVTVGADDDIVCTITNVRETGQLELIKDLVPSDDDGSFNLFIKTDGGGTTVDSATDVGDGGTTGINEVNTGTYEVSETAGTGTSLDDYTSTVSCVDRGTTNVVASGTGAGPVDVTVGTDDDIVCTITNTLEEGGSITVVKEITCEVCETFTPGAFFNQGENNAMSAFAQASLSGDPIVVAGLTFDSVQSVQDNAAPGSLLRHYLALALNLRLAEDNECDLANLVYDGSIEALQGMTVGEIAAVAEAVLNGEDSDFTEEQLHDAIDEINNNHGATDGVLVCDADGTSAAGFEFTLFDDEDVEVDSGTTGADGSLTFSNLPPGTYTLVETGGPEGSDCSVVSASGEGVTFDDATGVITIVLTENADVTVTVVNECEVLPPPPPPGEGGDIVVMKEDASGAPKSGATFDLYLDDGDGEFDPEGTGGGGGGPTQCVGAANLAAAGATDIANAIVADGSTLTGASATAPSGTPNGTADCLSWFATHGSNFGILTSGDVNLADDANNAQDSGADLGGASLRGDSDFDVTVLQLNLTAPVGANCLEFDFAFYSEEFEEYVGTTFNDAFIAELNASTWTTSGSTISAPNNFAFDPSHDVISINSTGATAMTEANANGTTYDGATALLSAATPIAGAANTLYLSIFDQGDGAYDSAVFVDNVRFLTVANVATDCVAGAQVVSGGDELIDTQTTGADGKATFSGLEPGTYWLDETQAPAGCEIVDQTTKVELTEADLVAGEPVVVVVENDCEAGGGGPVAPPPGGGTLGGNPTPTPSASTLANTATEFGMNGSVLAALVALLMLSGIGVAGYAARAEVRRRR